MTDVEILILRTKLQAETNPAIVAARDARNDTECANLLNAATASVIWRNNVTRAEIYHRTRDATLAGGTPTTWNWTTYKNQSVPEQGAWTQMFMGESADFTLPNLRAAVGAIFGAGNAQTSHVAAIAKRFARKGETYFLTGSATVGSPGVPTWTGLVSPDDIGKALNNNITALKA